MGNSIPNSIIVTRTNIGKTFQITYHDLVDHIVLLRQVIAHPEMTREGPTLNFFIHNYCKRMAHQKMKNPFQQVILPWEIDWIWHIHRLHPLAYYNDCTSYLSDGQLVDKKYSNFYAIENALVPESTPTDSPPSTFVCSIDLAKAAVRQRAFLENFRKHFLYSRDLKELDRPGFHQMVKNYILFMQLARKKETIVPTFDIDLLWHTHMRFPLQYRELSTVLCGFVLDHNDAIQRNKLKDAYQNTANRWKDTYKSDYNHADDLILFEAMQDQSYCGGGNILDRVSTWTEESSSSSSDGGSDSSCSSCGGD